MVDATAQAESEWARAVLQKRDANDAEGRHEMKMAKKRGRQTKPKEQISAANLARMKEAADRASLLHRHELLTQEYASLFRRTADLPKKFKENKDLYKSQCVELQKLRQQFGQFQGKGPVVR